MKDVVEEILNTKLKRFKHNCPLDITDLVFLEIEKSYMHLYKIHAKKKGTRVINRIIGGRVKEYWNLEKRGICKRPKSILIGSYEEHCNIKPRVAQQ